MCICRKLHVSLSWLLIVEVDANKMYNIPSTCEEHFLQVWASLVEVFCIETSKNALAVCIGNVYAKKCPVQPHVATTSSDNIPRGEGEFMLISLPPSNVNLLQVGTAISQSVQSFCRGKTTTPDVQGDEVPGMAEDTVQHE